MTKGHWRKLIKKIGGYMSFVKKNLKKLKILWDKIPSPFDLLEIFQPIADSRDNIKKFERFW